MERDARYSIWKIILPLCLILLMAAVFFWIDLPGLLNPDRRSRPVFAAGLLLVRAGFFTGWYRWGHLNERGSLPSV